MIMITEEVFLKIVRNSIKAPSGHNTQPWLFAKSDDDICIMPDAGRALPVADPNHRELYISLGCAAETAMIAARFYGYQPALEINALNSDGSLIISLRKDDTIEQPELFSYIASRQTTRNLYVNKPVPGQDLETLKTTVSEEGVSVRFYTGQHEIRQFSPFIAEANAIQMGNPKFKNELIQWMRFSEKEAMQKGDGLYTACNGIPSMGRLLGSFVLQNFVNARSENKRLLKQLENSAAVALFTSRGDSMEEWIKTGLAFQRFALTATKLNIRYSFLNPPCQIAAVREKMMTTMDLKGEIPHLIIRLGYSKKMPYAMHRNVYQYINHYKSTI